MLTHTLGRAKTTEAFQFPGAIASSRVCLRFISSAVRGMQAFCNAWTSNGAKHRKAARAEVERGAQGTHATDADQLCQHLEQPNMQPCKIPATTGQWTYAQAVGSLDPAEKLLGTLKSCSSHRAVVVALNEFRMALSHCGCGCVFEACFRMLAPLKTS